MGGMGSGYAAESLRRLTEQAQEGASHSLSVAEAGPQGDLLDWVLTVLHLGSRNLGTKTLDRPRRRFTRLLEEKAGELPAAYARRLSQPLYRQVLLQMFARIGECIADAG